MAKNHGEMQMDQNTFQQFKKLLLGIPGWNHGGTRKAFLQDVFWGHDLLNDLNYEVPGGRAATELIELLLALESPDIDRLTPACALFKAIREKYGAGTQRSALLADLERMLCASTVLIRSVLFCAANPEDHELIRTDREFKQIKEALSPAAGGQAITLHSPELALRGDELIRSLHRTEPGIVHFSGHGGGQEGIYFEDEQGNSTLVTADALASVFRQFVHCVKVVVLNACFSEPQAEAITTHIDYVIGTRQDIGDDTATAFSKGFYQALAAGRKIPDAFQLGCAQIRMEGIPEHAIPVLLTGPGETTACAD